MGFSLEELLGQKQQAPDSSQAAVQTYLASNETPRALAMNDAPPPMPPPQSPIKTALMNAVAQEPKPAPDDSGDAAKSSGPALDDLSKYKVTPEELQQAHDNKRAALMMGAVGDGLANQQSWGNYYSGKMNAHNDVMGDAQKFADLADDNIKNKQVLASQGMKENESRAKMAKSAMDMMKAQREEAADAMRTDPNSQMAQMNALVIAKIAPKIGIDIDPKELAGMSFAQQQEVINKNPLLKEAYQADAMGKRFALMASNQSANRDLREQSLDLKRDNQASAAGQTVEKAVAPFKKTLNSIDRAESILNGKEPVTAKTLAIAQQDFINSVAAGGAATEGKVNREMIDTIGTEINAIKLKYGDISDLRKSSPELISHLKGLFGQVKQDYGQAMQQQMQDVSGSYSQTGNQKVQDVLKGKGDRYGVKPDAGASNMAPKDVEALQWAKQNKGTPEAQQILLKISKQYPGAQ